MKKLITLLLILALVLPAFALAESTDPIVGSWYIMLDYGEYAKPEAVGGKTFMLLILRFEESGQLIGISEEDTVDNPIQVNGSVIGSWANENGKYTVNMIGVGTNPAYIEGDRLLLNMVGNIWYSMRCMEIGSWFTDIVTR